MKPLERIRLSLNAAHEGLRMEVWSPAGGVINATLDLDGEDAAALAAQLVLISAVSGAAELDLADQIMGRLLMLRDDLSRGVGLISRASVLPDPEAEEHTEPEPAASEPGAAEAPYDFEVFPNPDQAVRCTDCGRLCANRTGLAVHRRSAHPEKNSLEQGEPAESDEPEPERPQPAWTEAAGDLRSRGWRCIRCPVTGRGGGGWQKHWDAAHSERAEADEYETLHRPPAPGFTSKHRIEREDRGVGVERVYCECEWISPPCETREEAREAWVTHRDEMDAARVSA